MNFINLFKNPYILFTGTRYCCYFILFIRGFFIAKILGPYYFGVWGLLTLYLQYLSVSTLGIQYALNNELSINSREDNKTINTLISSAFFISTGIAIVLFLLFAISRIFNLNLDVVSVNGENHYILILLVIICLQNLQQLFNNIYRVYNKLMIIAITEVIVALGTLLVIFFFTGEALIYAFFICWGVSLLLVNLLFLYFKPFNFDLNISWRGHCVFNEIRNTSINI